MTYRFLYFTDIDLFVKKKKSDNNEKLKKKNPTFSIMDMAATNIRASHFFSCMHC